MNFRPLLFYAGLATGAVQNAQRRAPMGISLKQSRHFIVVGSAGGSLRARATR